MLQMARRGKFHICPCSFRGDYLVRFRTFSCGYILTNLYRALKKQVIYIFCINVVAFGIVFYSQYVLRPCVINGYVVEKLRKLSYLYNLI